MPSESAPDVKFEIGHVLFIDIVGYSKLSINEQHAAVDELTQIVRGTGEFREERMAKRIVNIRLRPDQEERINAIVERSAILDTSKFVRIAVDWLLRSDIGEVIKTIVDDKAFPDYQIRKKRTGRKKHS